MPSAVFALLLLHNTLECEFSLCVFVEKWNSCSNIFFCLAKSVRDNRTRKCLSLLLHLCVWAPLIYTLHALVSFINKGIFSRLFLHLTKKNVQKKRENIFRAFAAFFLHYYIYTNMLFELIPIWVDSLELCE